MNLEAFNIQQINRSHRPIYFLDCKSIKIFDTGKSNLLIFNGCGFFLIL